MHVNRRSRLIWTQLQEEHPSHGLRKTQAWPRGLVLREPQAPSQWKTYSWLAGECIGLLSIRYTTSPVSQIDSNDWLLIDYFSFNFTSNSSCQWVIPFRLWSEHIWLKLSALSNASPPMIAHWCSKSFESQSSLALLRTSSIASSLSSL